ncbi:hypothetical protein Aperf_G00000109704 [Anoplocephala perfoliata]
MIQAYSNSTFLSVLQLREEASPAEGLLFGCLLAASNARTRCNFNPCHYQPTLLPISSSQIVETSKRGDRTQIINVQCVSKANHRSNKLADDNRHSHLSRDLSKAFNRLIIIASTLLLLNFFAPTNAEGGELEPVPRTPPEFLMRLYKSTTDDHGRSSAPSPYQADSVLAFLDEKLKYDSVSQYAYFFNISQLPHNTVPIQAEFHLYREVQRNISGSRSPSSFRRAAQLYPFIFLKLCYVKTDAEGRESLEVIDIKRIFRHNYGWIIFGVNDALNYWFQSDQKNAFIGLVLKVTYGDGTPIREGNEGNFIQRYSPNAGRLQPCLIVYCRVWPFRTPSLAIKTEENSDLTQDFDYSDPWQNHRPYMEDYLQPQNLQRTKRNNMHLSRAYSLKNRQLAGRRHCRRRKMIVDFAKLNMTDWILAPVTFDAGVCVGICTFPLGQESHPTNHAVLQSVWARFLRSTGSANVSTGAQLKRMAMPPPQPCCAPHELEDLPMLYFQSDNRVILNHRSDMIVRSCGCK